MQIIKYLFDEIANYFLEKIKINAYLNIYADIINVGNLIGNKKISKNCSLNKCDKIIFKFDTKNFIIYRNKMNQISNF